MLKPYNRENSYANRPLTPLGENSGLTSTPVSEGPTRQNTPPPMDPYKYQPAMAWTHACPFPRSSSNYSHAASTSESIVKVPSTVPLTSGNPTLPIRRRCSYSAGDIKRHTDEDLKSIIKEEKAKDDNKL